LTSPCAAPPSASASTTASPAIPRSRSRFSRSSAASISRCTMSTPSPSLLSCPWRREASALILARTFWSRIAWRVEETSGEREVSESWDASSSETCGGLDCYWCARVWALPGWVPGCRKPARCRPVLSGTHPCWMWMSRYGVVWWVWCRSRVEGGLTLRVRPSRVSSTWAHDGRNKVRSLPRRRIFYFIASIHLSIPSSGISLSLPFSPSGPFF
jgi:hypothetical protein